MIIFNNSFQPDYDDIEDDYARKPVITNEDKRSRNDDKKKYGKWLLNKLSRHLNYHHKRKSIVIMIKEFFFF